MPICLQGDMHRKEGGTLVSIDQGVCDGNLAAEKPGEMRDAFARLIMDAVGDGFQRRFESCALAPNHPKGTAMNLDGQLVPAVDLLNCRKYNHSESFL